MNFATVAALLISSVSAQAFKGTTPRTSFFRQSENLNEITQVSFIIMVIGFALFGILYLSTVIYIFYDTHMRGVMFDNEIENDIAQMKSLGIDMNDASFQQGLKNAIAGIREEDKGDDQLFGTAVKVTDAEWRKEL